MWTRGSTPWAAGPQYSGWCPPDNRKDTSLSFQAGHGESGTNLCPVMNMGTQNISVDNSKPAEMYRNFELQRPSPMISDENTFRSNSEREEFGFHSGRLHNPLPRGHQDQSLNFGGTRMFQLALNQARPIRNIESTPEWSNDLENSQRSDKSLSTSTSNVSAHWNGFGFPPNLENEPNLSAESHIFIPNVVSGFEKQGFNSNGTADSAQNMAAGCGTDDYSTCHMQRFCTDMSVSGGTLQPFSAIDEIDLSRHQTPVQIAPRRLFVNSGKESSSLDSPSFDLRKWASPTSFIGGSGPPLSFASSGSEREFPTPVQPAVSSMKMGPVGFCRQVELFGGSGPSYKPDCEERMKSPSAQCSPPQQAIPSPMPPKPKVVQMPMTVGDETLAEEVAGIDRKTCDALLLNTLVYMVNSHIYQCLQIYCKFFEAAIIRF